MKNRSNEGKISGIGKWITDVWKFVSEDIWRITDRELSGIKHFSINLLKTLYLSIRNFIEDNISSRASALTYNSLLAVVPLLALLLAIAKGFGFKNIIQSQLFVYFPAQKDMLEHAFSFVDAYLQQAQGGMFIGIGIVFLLWTVFSLVSNIELVLNEIWQIKKPRTFYRRVTDYTSLFLLLPILMIVSSGISIFLTTGINGELYNMYISPMLMKLISFSPYILTWAFFTGMYMFMPNTKVKFKNAVVSGIICGTVFQIFQFIYIGGQIWVSKYNAIYGSFAFLPLLLLWMQLSWIIFLYGAELSFSSQNIANYNFERDTKHISRRYRDFIVVLVMSAITKRFSEGEKPLTQSEIIAQFHLPVRLTYQTLNLLLEIGVINETPSEEDRVTAYQPAIDVQRLTVARLLENIDVSGSENFNLQEEERFPKEWEAVITAREAMYKQSKDVLLKDL